MIDIEDGQVHLWLTFSDEVRDQNLMAEYERLVHEDERGQAARFYFERDRHRHLVTRVLIRCVLSRYTRVQPREWTFRANQYGRPEIANEDLSAREIVFNVSHTEGLIILAVARGRALGVDTENVQARQPALDIADRFFAPDEVSALGSMPAERRGLRFFEYWTLKESYIKARGMGLSIPLEQFSFSFPQDHKIQIRIESNLNDASARWHFWQFQPTSDYVTAVCAERTRAPQLHLLMHKIVPLHYDERFTCSLTRVSECEHS